MAIVIKEIIISDNLEKFMEKVNFNFDQLLLAGGGPQGPIGPQGNVGPAGPKGDPGTKWYVGATGSTLSLEPLGGTAFTGDLFLADGLNPGFPLGDVYQYEELSDVWTYVANIRGPIGPTGPGGPTGGASSTYAD